MTTPAISKTRDEFLIYVAMLLVLESVYGGSLVASPELRDPVQFIPFTGLMGLHAALHLIVPRLSPRQLWLPPYFVVQGVLAFTLIRIASIAGGAISLYLYLALAAQAIGLLSNRPRLAVALVVGYLVLGVITFVSLWGWGVFPPFLVLAGPQTLFVLALAVLFFRQANDRRRAQTLLRDLELAHRQLSEYADRVEDLTLTNERQRLARDLHDTLAQGLVGLILQLEAIDKQLTQGRHERAQLIATQAMASARTTLADARRAIDDLRIADKQAGTLGDALRGEAERFTNATGLPCIIEMTETEDIILPDKVQDSVLQIVAEGLTNIGRHACASQAWVNVAVTDGVLCVGVRDNGVGFNVEEMRGRTGHYGLIGMRERARLAGGSLEVISKSEEGTTLMLHLPIPLAKPESIDA